MFVDRDRELNTPVTFLLTCYT